MQNYAFIGMGNMARAIASGLIESGAVQASAMCAYAPHQDKLRAFCEPLGIRPCQTAREAISAADTVIMAVKPYVVEGVLHEQRSALAGKALLSVVAGYTLERYSPLLEASTRVQYIMPNTPCRVGEGMLLFEEAHSLTDEERAQAEALFAHLGRVASLPARLMGAGMAISGCGPAYAAMMIEALADAGVKYGLPRDTAYLLAAQTLAGTGKLQTETKTLPAQLKDEVCSPAGTTIRGVEALEKGGFRAAIFAAVQASLHQ